MVNIKSLNGCIREIFFNDGNHSLLIRPLQESHAEMIYAAVVLSRENLRPFMDWSHREPIVEGQI